MFAVMVAKSSAGHYHSQNNYRFHYLGSVGEWDQQGFQQTLGDSRQNEDHYLGKFFFFLLKVAYSTSLV